MGPLSGIGDTFSGEPSVSLVRIGIPAMQRNLLGPLLFLLIYNIPNFLVRYYEVRWLQAERTQSTHWFPAVL